MSLITWILMSLHLIKGSLPKLGKKEEESIQFPDVGGNPYTQHTHAVRMEK
jgi:hypothetical protein